MAQLAKTRLYSMLLEPRFKRLRVIVTATTKVSFAEIYRCVPAVLVRITVGALTTAILPVIPAFVHLAIPVPISSAIAKTKATLFSINFQIFLFLAIAMGSPSLKLVQQAKIWWESRRPIQVRLDLFLSHRCQLCSCCENSV